MCSAIVKSRKRKLRELFAVATEVDGIPNFDFSDPDALPITEAESKFLADCDISQYAPLLSQKLLNQTIDVLVAMLRVALLTRLIEGESLARPSYHPDGNPDSTASSAT